MCNMNDKKYNISKKDFWKDVIISILMSIILLDICVQNKIWILKNDIQMFIILVFQMWIILVIIISVEDKINQIIYNKKIKRKK